MAVHQDSGNIFVPQLHDYLLYNDYIKYVFAFYALLFIYTLFHYRKVKNSFCLLNYEVFVTTIFWLYTIDCTVRYVYPTSWIKINLEYDLFSLYVEFLKMFILSRITSNQLKFKIRASVQHLRNLSEIQSQNTDEYIYHVKNFSDYKKWNIIY